MGSGMMGARPLADMAPSTDPSGDNTPLTPEQEAEIDALAAYWRQLDARAQRGPPLGRRGRVKKMREESDANAD